MIQVPEGDPAFDRLLLLDPGNGYEAIVGEFFSALLQVDSEHRRGGGDGADHRRRGDGNNGRGASDVEIGCFASALAALEEAEGGLERKFIPEPFENVKNALKAFLQRGGRKMEEEPQES
jgi:hypothetical protein